MTTLIIGAGMIGSFVAKEFSASGEKVILLGGKPDRSYIQKVSNMNRDMIVDKMILNEEDLLTVIDHDHVKNVIVCAGMMKNHLEKDSHMSIYNESQLNLSILYALSSSKRVQSVTYISSLGVYGDHMPEDKVKPKPNSMYGTVKLYNEHVYKKLHDLNPTIDVNIIRPIGVLGPCPKVSGNWMSQLVRNIYFSNKPIKVESNQDSLEILDVRDLSRVIYQTYKNHNGLCEKNVRSHQFYEVNTLLEHLCEAYEKEIRITYNDKSHNHVTNNLSKQIQPKGFFDLRSTLEMIGDFYNDEG
ncbi:NAD-dependent epimerase/dehydratase family protein [Pontibacillus marinus]|uniref:NAD-dependent epimerase/dehydratase domain-containing protein n=1 Tax=Pontibacillus marinus BH030004 = DSM 16465 TaxID=1385511 RepID=A0A0A5GEY9_9BACI|nr:NAD(P)-dependent oxidoreductase [Pontibacillus marinus]KGX89690.1 hypothetical protein N783_04725 [Pontibacillus marinus BH030004 = DSM 16465]